MGITLGTYGATSSAGWTTFTASGSAQNGFNGVAPATTSTMMIYVSNSTGKDPGDVGYVAGTAGSSSTPYRTIKQGLSVLRSGSPDWLLLRKGDIWTDESFMQVNTSGKSNTEPLVLGAYDPANPAVVNPSTGGARPLIKTPNTDPGADPVHIGVKMIGDFWAIVGIEFYSYQRDPGNLAYVGSASVAQDDGIAIASNPLPTFLLIEDCKISFYFMAIDYPASTDTAGVDHYIRRNVLYDANGVGNAVLLHPANASNLVIEENVLDQNVTGSTGNGFGRVLYHTQCGNAACSVAGPPMASFRGNIVANSLSEGVQFRCGVTLADDNLFIRGTNGFDVGHQVGDTSFQCTSAVCSNNVIIGTASLSGVGEAGGGIDILHAQGSGVKITGNILLSPEAASPSSAVTTDEDTDLVQITNNIIHNWTPAFSGPYIDSHASVGSLLTWTISNGGSGYTNGTYNSVPMNAVVVTGGGHGARLTVTVAGGAVTSVQDITTGNSFTDFRGLSYLAGETITPDPASMGGTGSGCVIAINSVTTGPVLSGNKTPGDGSVYADSTRTVATYAGSIGLTASNAAFLTAARGLTKANWDSRYTAPAANTYIRAGFSAPAAARGGHGKSLKYGF